MSIFRKKGKGNPDLSRNLKSTDSWCLRQYERLSAGHVVALTYDPVLDVYACGNCVICGVYNHLKDFQDWIMVRYTYMEPRLSTSSLPFLAMHATA